MEFENQYLTYDEYLDFEENEIGEMPFNLLEYEARKKIDLRTQNRLVGLQDIPMPVKMCVYKLIKTIQNYNKTNKNVLSESTDGYSVSYNNNSDATNIYENYLEDIMFEYLNGVIINNTPILYLGV